MIIFKIIRADSGNEVGLASSVAVAFDSVRISYSAWKDAKYTENIDGITVSRKGFPPLRFQVFPVELYIHATHL